MTPQEETALLIWQSHRDTDRAVVGALIDDCLAPPEYTAALDAVRTSMSEDQEMPEIDIGQLTSGIRMNAADICDLFWHHPERRSEFCEREIKDIQEAVLGLWTLLREIERQERPRMAG